MTPINWPGLIRALLDSGVTQPQLAEAAGCGQSTISDLLRGKTTDPRTSTGLALIRMGNSRCGLDIRLEGACGAAEGALEAATTQPAAQEAA